MNIRKARIRLACATVALAAAMPPLLHKMRRDFAEKQAFQRSTALLMWATYGLGSFAYAEALRLGKKPPGRRRCWCPLRCNRRGGACRRGHGCVRGVRPGHRHVAWWPGGLVTHGVYRYSRNPQYAGITLAAGAGAVATRSWPAALVTAGLALTYRFWVPVEEAALRRSFGEEYVRYTQVTPRWIGRARD